MLHFAIPSPLVLQVAIYFNFLSGGFIGVLMLAEFSLTSELMKKIGSVCTALALICCSCRTHDSHSHSQMPAQTGKNDPTANVIATVWLSAASSSNVRGLVNFIRQSDGRVRVYASVTGLTPGKHGFHIHEKGDCSAPDASSAGGHFNPTGMPHGGPHDTQRHVGDFGNLEADESGTAHYSRVFSDIPFDGDRSVIGRAVIVHAQPDDMKTQPTGNAGGRVACGVIERK